MLNIILAVSFMVIAPALWRSVSGRRYRPFHEVAPEEVLPPSGMVDTAFEELDQDPLRYATGYLHAEDPTGT